MQPRTAGGGGGKTSDEVVSELADELLEKLPAELKAADAAEATFATLADGR